MNIDLFSVRDRRVLVVGGTRGIGGAISRQLAGAGARVLANHVRDDTSATALRQDAEASGGQVECLRADVTSAKGLESLIQGVAERFTPLDAMVYAAATGVHKPVEQLSLRHYDWTFALNVRAFLDVVQRLLPHFAPSAAVVGVSSAGAVRAIPQYTLVGASKGALEAMVRHLAVELAPRGLRFNTLSPGTVLTDAWKVLPDAERRLEEAARQSPRGRLTTLDEVAAAAQFLCSDASAGLIGHTLVVDGGARLCG
jgi:NAD(P)-dependent dehydrogenase (short-subunit alcohol dehydrogenase family)